MYVTNVYTCMHVSIVTVIISHMHTGNSIHSSQGPYGCLLPLSIISVVLFITIITALIIITILVLKKVKVKKEADAPGSELTYEEIDIKQLPTLSTSDNIAYCHVNVK